MTLGRVEDVWSQLSDIDTDMPKAWRTDRKGKTEQDSRVELTGESTEVRDDLNIERARLAAR